MNEKTIERRLLNMQREVLMKLTAVDGDVHQSNKASNRTPSEQNIEINSLDVLFALDAESRHRLNRINNALNRLYRKEYNRCANCGQPLSDQRLELKPLSDLCESCESALH